MSVTWLVSQRVPCSSELEFFLCMIKKGSPFLTPILKLEQLTTKVTKQECDQKKDWQARHEEGPVIPTKSTFSAQM